MTTAPLGSDLSMAELTAAAAVWNDRLDEWRNNRDSAVVTEASRYGTVEWLIESYLKHDSFIEKVSPYSRPDYRRVLDRISALEIRSDKTGAVARVGDLAINQIAVSTAEKIYKAFHAAGAARTSEKVVMYCKTMWQRMRPHHPNLFRSDHANPWEGVTVKRRQKRVKHHVDRVTTYAFARGAIEAGAPELAAAAVLAFEWLMRPSSIGAGFASWTGYRGNAHPDKIAIRHRKTGASALHPLEDIDASGAHVLLYADAEAILAQAPRVGLSIVCKPNGELYGDGTLLSQRVREIADRLGLPDFTLDAARHGGMTELEEAGLTEGEGRAISQHKTAAAYRGYAKETEIRMLNATRKRFGRTGT